MGASGDGGQGVCSVDNIPVPGLAGTLVQQASWLNASTLVYMTDSATETYALPHGPRTTLRRADGVAVPPGNWLYAGFGTWALRRQARVPSYEDTSRLLVPSDYRPKAVTPHGVLAMAYAAGGGAYWLTPTTVVELVPPTVPVLRGDMDAWQATWAVRLAPDLVQWSESSVPVRIPASDDLALAGDVLVTNGRTAGALIGVDLRRGTWGVLTAAPSFWPHAALRADGTVAVVASRTQGEGPGDGHVTLVTPAQRATWQPITAPPPPPPPDPPTDPSPTPRAFPGPIWVAPYHSHTPRWGETTDHVGNAVLLHRWPESQTPFEARAYARRVGTETRLPLILDADSYSADVASLCVALYVHAATAAEGLTTVQAWERQITLGALPDVPIILYIDAPDPWTPEVLTSSALDRSRHWLSPQCYRAVTETLPAFEFRATGLLDWLSRDHWRLAPTVQAYDRNVPQPEVRLLETLRLAGDWVRPFNLVGLLPFSDRRSGTLADGTPVGGMTVYPSLREEVRSWLARMSEERPNRYDFWSPRFVTQDDQIRNKLKQTRPRVWLSQADKDRILQVMG